MNKAISKITNFIRETRNEIDEISDSTERLEAHFFFFMGYLFISFACIMFLYLFILLVSSEPKFFIPLFFTLFVLWKGYKKL